MKSDLKDPPRSFFVGADAQIEIRDCGQVFLEADEQITFVGPSGKEHDFTAKAWGFYATPSVNGRLRDQGFKTALVRNSHDKCYVMVVDVDEMEAFETYLATEKNEVLEWLDER